MQPPALGSLLQVNKAGTWSMLWVQDTNLSPGLFLVFVGIRVPQTPKELHQAGQNRVYKAPQHQDRRQAPWTRKRASYNIQMPAFHRTNGGEHTAPTDIADCGHPKAWHVNAKKKNALKKTQKLIGLVLIAGVSLFCGWPKLMLIKYNNQWRSGDHIYWKYLLIQKSW